VSRRVRVQVAAYLYPWDVDGDASAPERIAGLGVQEVTLAAAYHAVRAVTPFHPAHRIVTRDAAVYYRPELERWRDSKLQPVIPDSPDEHAGSFERAAGQLHAAGLRVNAWIVLAHNARLGAAHPDCTVRNAYGDSYPWALCIASPEVRAYAATLAAEAAALTCVDGIELEACGWYGFDHLSAHDKTGHPAGHSEAAAALLDVCFCPGCQDAYRAAGLDPRELTRQVRTVLDTGFAQASAEPTAAQTGTTDTSSSQPASAAAALPAEIAATLHSVRAEVAADFLQAVLAAARAAAPGKPVFVHSHPDPRQVGANPGHPPASLLAPGGPDGIVLQCWGTPTQSADLVAKTAQGAAPAGTPPCIAASLLAVAALGGRPADLPEQAKVALAAGATELRLYHAGLASTTDLAAMRDLLTSIRGVASTEIRPAPLRRGHPHRGAGGDSRAAERMPLHAGRGRPPAGSAVRAPVIRAGRRVLYTSPVTAYRSKRA
jgi:hypothetical protein